MVLNGPQCRTICALQQMTCLLKCSFLNYITLKLQCCCLTLITTEENEYVSSVADGNQKILSETQERKGERVAFLKVHS